MTDNAEILLLSHADWGALGNPAEPMARALARHGFDVAFSPGMFYSWEVFGPYWNDAPLLSRVSGESGITVHFPGKLPFRWLRSPLLDRMALKHECARITVRPPAPAARRVALVLHPRFADYLEHLRCDKVIYWAVDLLSAQPGYGTHLEASHQALLQHADLLLAASASVGEIAFGSRFQPGNVLHSAVDVEPIIAARNAPVPADLEPIPHPRIGYVGAINQKVDVRAIAHVARNRPDWHWVLLGPVHVARTVPGVEDISGAWHECEKLDNVHWLGPKPFTDVPAYLNHMDVNTICYRLDVGDWTRTAYPFKVHECLAAGRPVVSSRMPELLRHEDVIEFAETPEQWVDAIARALASPEEQRQLRLDTARQNTWDKRAREFFQWLSEIS